LIVVLATKVDSAVNQLLTTKQSLFIKTA